MTHFSASDAALEGYTLIRRRWRVVLGWAGFNLLSLVMLIVVTVLFSLITAALSNGARGSVAIVAGLVAGLGTLFAQAIIATGVFRLEMRSQEPAFLHLRLGRDEFRLIGVWLVTITGAWGVGWVAAMLGHAARVASAWIDLLALVLVIYLGLRFALAAPISFAEHCIDFPRSWRLTRGRAWALLGMSALSFCLIGLLMVTVFVALALVATGAAGLDGLAGLFGGAESLRRHPGLWLLEFGVEIILTPVLWVLSLAPLAAAYRAFT